VLISHKSIHYNPEGDGYHIHTQRGLSPFKIANPREFVPEWLLLMNGEVVGFAGCEVRDIASLLQRAAEIDDSGEDYPEVVQVEWGITKCPVYSV